MCVCKNSWRQFFTTWERKCISALTYMRFMLIFSSASLCRNICIFQTNKRKKHKLPAKAITDADYADDIALLAYAPAQAEALLHSLERAASGIGLHVKTEYMCFNQIGVISTLNGSSLKLVDKFTYLGSSVSSTEKDIDTRLAKAWTTIGRMEVRPDR